MMKHIKWILILAICVIGTTIEAQKNEFEIILQPFEIPGLNGIQSFASGEFNGKFFIFGGRLDGLHRRQPFASFDIAGHNNQIFMVDPVEKIVRKRLVSELPPQLREPLSSTNMQFYQESNFLYLIGGYGYSPTLGDHTTFNTITRVDLHKLHDALVNNTSVSDAFMQINDDRFQVTGGYLGKINEYYYLVCGQLFKGRYNPMGPDFGPGFIQEYTDAIKKFKIVNEAEIFSIEEYSEWKDTEVLHRRDYNMAPQIFPDGKQGLTAFSGVFRKDADLPFLNCVNIRENDFAVQPDFVQLYNHYHCAHLTMYDSIFNEMHTVFFGGIAQYYRDNGLLVKDDNVPFVKTIATVWRDQEGIMKEKKLNAEMPGLLGSGAEFIPTKNLGTYSNNILKYHQLTGDSIFLGYIFGGIASSSKNIFFINDGTQSSASPVLFRVFIKKNEISDVSDAIKKMKDTELKIYPNPTFDQITIEFELTQNTSVNLKVIDASGKILHNEYLNNLSVGKYKIVKNIEKFAQNPIFVTIGDGNKIYSKQIIKSN